MISPVGHTPPSSAAALRAGISNFEELVYKEKGGDCVVGAMVADIPAEIRGRARISGLATRALGAVPAQLIKKLPWQQMPIYVCSPEPGAPVRDFERP